MSLVLVLPIAFVNDRICMPFLLDARVFIHDATPTVMLSACVFAGECSVGHEYQFRASAAFFFIKSASWVLYPSPGRTRARRPKANRKSHSPLLSVSFRLLLPSKSPQGHIVTKAWRFCLGFINAPSGINHALLAIVSLLIFTVDLPHYISSHLLAHLWNISHKSEARAFELIRDKSASCV